MSIGTSSRSRGEHQRTEARDSVGMRMETRITSICAGESHTRGVFFPDKLDELGPDDTNRKWEQLAEEPHEDVPWFSHPLPGPVLRNQHF